MSKEEMGNLGRRLDYLTTRDKRDAVWCGFDRKPNHNRNRAESKIKNQKETEHH